jgi:hypothetical protein
VPGYRCYFLSSDDHIRAVDNMAETLGEAIERASCTASPRGWRHEVVGGKGSGWIAARATSGADLRRRLP